MRAVVAVHAIAFQLVVRAWITSHTVADDFSLRTWTALRAPAFQLAVRAGVAVHALALYLSVRPGVAVHADTFQLAAMGSARFWFPFFQTALFLCWHWLFPHRLHSATSSHPSCMGFAFARKAIDASYFDHKHAIKRALSPRASEHEIYLRISYHSSSTTSIDRYAACICSSVVCIDHTK